MKAHLLWLFAVINLILLVSGASAHDSAVSAGAPLAAPVGTAFTYQGRLRSNSKPFNGRCDFQFSLWDAVSGGAQVGGTLPTNNVAVSDGRFTVQLDFGAVAFNGNGLWLQVAVRCPTGGGGFTTLAPRQALAPTPYAVRATSAGSVPWSGITSKPAGFADNIDNNTIYSAGNGLTLVGTQFNIAVPLGLIGSDSFTILGVRNNGQPNPSNGFYADAIFGISPQGRGVEGQSTSDFAVAGFSSSNAGVYGRSTKSSGTWGTSDSGAGAGAMGNSTGADGTGVYGIANNGSNAYGVWGASSSGFAGYFNGNVHIQGTLSKSAGSFKIDHPLDPANKYLSHSFVESPDMKNIYDGVVTLDANGAATVTLPDWFEALNQDFRYQLTAIGAPGPNLYIAQEIQGNRFAVAGGKPGMKVSWQVTGIRHDPYAEQNRIQVEEAKPPAERGKYLYPEGYSQPATKGENYAKQQQLVQSQSQPAAQSKAP